jgi:hypothetical protein
MRTSLKVAIGSVAVATVIAVAGLGLSVASASTHHAVKPAGRMVTASAPLAKSGKAGWQGEFTYDVPPGISGLFFHYDCPSGRKALDGGFGISSTDSSAATISLIGNQARPDISPLYSAWGWTFIWPGTVAPSGSEISFNAYCK